MATFSEEQIERSHKNWAENGDFLSRIGHKYDIDE